MLRKPKEPVSLRLSKTDDTKLNRLREPQADTICVTSVSKCFVKQALAKLAKP
jgi:hypothetical protein